MVADGGTAKGGLLAYASHELAGTRYAPVAHLASGAFGDVFVVRHPDLGVEYVLKLLKAEFKAHGDVVERLKVEARILTRLTHPNLMRVTDFGWSANGQPYLVSEKLTGETLLERVKRLGPMSAREGVDVVIQLLEGLAVAHESDIVHRDVKPANIFLAKMDGRDTVKVLDFGIAKVVDAERSAELGRHLKTAEGMVIGSPAYLAPEQILSRPVDARTDVYAAACVLYRIVGGRTPFVANTTEELIMAHLQEEPPPLSSLGSVPSGLDAVVARALAKERDARFASARLFVDALREVLASSDTPGPPVHAKVTSRGTVRISTDAMGASPIPSGYATRESQHGAEGDGTLYASRISPTSTHPHETEPPEVHDTERVELGFVHEVQPGSAVPRQVNVPQAPQNRRLIVLLVGVIALLAVVIAVMGFYLVR